MSYVADTIGRLVQEIVRLLSMFRHGRWPQRSIIDSIRAPKTPFTPTITRSPGLTKLTMIAFMAAKPVHEIGSVNVLVVRKSYRKDS